MKTLILYATKSGASRECAELLARSMPDCVIGDFSQKSADIRSFDTIIIGSGVRMGKIYKPALNFIQHNKDLLLTKKIAVYVCNAYPATFEKVVSKNIPADIIECVIAIKSFGGKAPFSNSQGGEWMNAENMAEFIRLVCGLGK